MSILDVIRRQAQEEHDRNMGWAATHTWDANVRNAYEAERERLRQQQQQDAARKNSGH